jgi:hypothetical protein
MKSLQERMKRKKRTKPDTRSGKRRKQETTAGFTVTNARKQSDQDPDESDIEKMSVDSLRTLVKGYRQSPPNQTKQSEVMEAMADRVERLATDDPRMRATRWLAQKRLRAPGAEHQTAEMKLIWDLQVKGIPIFNGERQTEMIKTFTAAFVEAVEVMNMGENETLMKAIFMSKLGPVARSWKQCIERGQPAEVPRTTMEWLQRIKRDFYPKRPEEMSKIKWAELTELRQDHHSLQWLIEAFMGLRNQIDHKTEEEVVRQFGIAANGYGNFKNIGQLILEEMVRAGVSEKPMKFLTAVHMAEKFASQEVEMRRTNNQTQRGHKEVPRQEAKVKTTRGELPAKGEHTKGRFIAEKRARIWSSRHSLANILLH